jgi:hypothetical protein
MQRFASCVDALDLMMAQSNSTVSLPLACKQKSRVRPVNAVIMTARMTVAPLKAAVGATRDRTAEVGRSLPLVDGQSCRSPELLIRRQLNDLYRPLIC